MLRIVTGPFHPDLEQALANEIRQHKAADPLAPLAIVVPSALLVSHLRELLVLEQALPLLNVHFLTFHQFTLRLYEEQWVLQGDEIQTRPLKLVPDLFFEYALSRMARIELPGSKALRLPSLVPGAWTALWATVRDLKDASVDPDTALRGVVEDLFGSEDAAALEGLFTLYAALLQTARALDAGSVEDFSAAVPPWVPASRFLARLSYVCYYGFYDLTQTQLSLFEQVARRAPVTLYFPLCQGSAFAFAQRFFERYLQPLIPSAHQSLRLLGCDASTGKKAAMPSVCIINTIGSDGELTITCKEILNLVEAQGYRFDEIGVVARTLEPYRNHLRRIFDQHRIPFVTTAVAPLMQEPIAKAVLLLAQLPVSGFDRATVLDLLTSPCYRVEAFQDSKAVPRSDLWRLVVRALGITRGEKEWRRLETAIQMKVWVDGSEDPEDSGDQPGGLVKIPYDQVQLLSKLVSRLIRDCQALPDKGTIGVLVEVFLQLLSNHLAIPGLTVSESSEHEDGQSMGLVGRAIRNVLDQIRQLDRTGDAIRWEEWTWLFTQAMERETIPIGSTMHPGVFVLDAMAARGLPFQALFVLGLNEKVFPRFIREDAFLRDRHRRVLAVTMGYKIDEKLDGYDEEQLLFALLRQAAQRRLYLLFQRADGEGRPLAPSAYLAEFHRSSQEAGQGLNWSVPRRFADRLSLPWFTPQLLTREELALWPILRGQNPFSFLEACGREVDLFRNGWTFLRAIEGGSRRLGVHDGLIDLPETYWKELFRRGVSPTPLEQYARCPFQYFGVQVLGLTLLRQPEAEELPAKALGELCHAVLRICYQRIVGIEWPEREVAFEELQKQVAAAVEESFDAYAVDYGIRHALLWEMAKETVAALVHEVLIQDQQELRKSGYRPIAFEAEAEGILDGLGASELGPIKIRGRLDRVDRRITPPSLRIVDYKYRHGQTMDPHDRDLLTAALRGFHLQPPLYALMSTKDAAGRRTEGSAEGFRPDLVEFLFLAPRWQPPVGRAQFDATAWRGSARQQLRETFRILLDGIRKGRYFIVPGNYCDHCDVATACRRFHGPTWWRAHRATHAKQLRLLRKQKVPRVSNR